MMKQAALFAALSLTPAIAHAGEAPRQAAFEYQGERYVYTVTETSRGKTLRGVVEGSGTPFILHVGRTQVSGSFGSTDVSFPRKAVKQIDDQEVVIASK